MPLLFVVRHKSGNKAEVDSVEAAITIHKARLAQLATQFEDQELELEEYEGLKLETEKIKVRYSANAKGSFKKSVTITSNASNPTQVLYFSGVVLSE